MGKRPHSTAFSEVVKNLPKPTQQQNVWRSQFDFCSGVLRHMERINSECVRNESKLIKFYMKKLKDIIFRDCSFMDDCIYKVTQGELFITDCTLLSKNDEISVILQIFL